MSTTVEPSTTGFRHFHDQLAQLKQRLLDMSDLATSLLDLSVDALLSRDAGLADAVLTTDRDVDALEVEIEDQAIGLLALQQPMARDLRFIIASIKVANDLERVGDHAVNIAQSALRASIARSSRRTTRSARCLAARDKCCATPSPPSCAPTGRSAATSVAPTTRWTRCTTRCSVSW
jgi:hypothetical protein